MLKNLIIKNILIKFRFLFCLIPALLGTNIYSNLQSINDVYGLYDAVKDGFKHLSPFHGFILIEKNITRNFYEYGPADDPMAQLVRDLFRLDGDTFKATIARNHIGSYLDNVKIGQLLATIEKNRNIDVEKRKGALSSDLKALIESYVINKIKDNVTAKVTQEVQDRHKKVKEVNPGAPDLAPEELDKAINSAINKEIIRVFSSRGKFKTIVSNFSDKLIDALSSVGYFSKEEQVYPAHTVHYIILSFLYAKINDKDDLQAYFDQFKNKDLDPEGILKLDDKGNMLQIWNKAYPVDSQISFLEDFKAQKEEGLWNYIIKNYESLGFAVIATEKYGGKYPPHLHYKTVLPEWFKYVVNPRTYTYSDCMETALRNLLNLTFHISGHFELPVIIDKNSVGAKFYEEFTIGQIAGQKAYDKWSTIVSNIAGVAYLRRSKNQDGKIITVLEAGIKPEEDDGWYYYELKPSLTNIWKVANHIFKLNLKDFDDFLKAFQLKCEKKVEETEVPVACKITDKNLRECTLGIKPMHGEVTGFEIAQIASNLEFQKILDSKILLKDFKHLDMVLNLFELNVDESNQLQGHIQELLDSSYFRYILMTRSLSNNLVKLYLFGFLLRELQDRPRTDWYMDFVKLLVASLIKDDPHLILETFSVLSVLISPSKNDLLQWTQNLIEEQFKNATLYYIGSLAFKLDEGRRFSNIKWITIEWLESLLEKANPFAFINSFEQLFNDTLTSMSAENLKYLVSKNLKMIDADFNRNILVQFLIKIAELVDFFGMEWVKSLIEASKTKLDDNQKSKLLSDGIASNFDFSDEIDWMKSLILDIHHPSAVLKSKIYEMEAHFGDDFMEQLKKHWQEFEISEEGYSSDDLEGYPDEPEEQFED